MKESCHLESSTSFPPSSSAPGTVGRGSRSQLLGHVRRRCGRGESCDTLRKLEAGLFDLDLVRLPFHPDCIYGYDGVPKKEDGGPKKEDGGSPKGRWRAPVGYSFLDGVFILLMLLL